MTEKQAAEGVPQAICRTYWGSHACDRSRGHAGMHVCGTPDDPCSQVENGQVRYWEFDHRGGPATGLSKPYLAVLFGEDVEA